MTQFLIKDCRGNSVQSLDRIASYDQVAREMLSICAQLPLQVWRHDTITGASMYDSTRTRALSDSVVKLRQQN